MKEATITEAVIADYAYKVQLRANNSIFLDCEFNKECLFKDCWFWGVNTFAPFTDFRNCWFNGAAVFGKGCTFEERDYSQEVIDDCRRAIDYSKNHRVAPYFGRWRGTSENY